MKIVTSRNNAYAIRHFATIVSTFFGRPLFFRGAETMSPAQSGP